MKQKRVAIYTRVSTLEQRNEGQGHELKDYAKRRGWLVAGVYADKISGIKNTRPELDRLLSDAKNGKFDCTLVWRIDRLGRSVTHLLQVLETFKVLGIEFISLSEAIVPKAIAETLRGESYIAMTEDFSVWDRYSGESDVLLNRQGWDSCCSRMQAGCTQVGERRTTTSVHEARSKVGKK
jgi:hypothetical protein